jgi:hypothetical protein
MPLKPNYKVDRWALPVPEREGVEGEHLANAFTTALILFLNLDGNLLSKK